MSANRELSHLIVEIHLGTAQMKKGSSKHTTQLAMCKAQCRRPIRGNMIVLVVAITFGLLLAVGLFSFNFIRMLGGSSEHSSAIDAAALAAATALGQIVVPDEGYGWISLNDYPPIGTMTVASDGEPQPVLGINTIVGTARLDTLVAHQLNDRTMITLAQGDVSRARNAWKNLRAHLERALSETGDPDAKTYNGEAIKPYDTAQNAYSANRVAMAGQANSSSNALKLSLGYIEEGSTTVTPVPQPNDPAINQVDASQQQDGNYKAFINIPADGEDFYFAGIGDQTELVDMSTFKQPLLGDDKRVCSIVKAEADVDIKIYNQEGGEQSRKVHNAACAQPGGSSDSTPPGTICISFPSGPVPNIDTPGDLLKDPQLAKNKGTVLSPQDGDWPGDGTLAPATINETSEPTPAQMFATGFYHWVRTARTKANLQDIKKLQAATFDSFGDPGDMTLVNPPPPQIGFRLFPPAIAEDVQESTHKIVQTGILADDLQDEANSCLTNMKNNTQAGRQAYWGMAGYMNVQSQLPKSTFMIAQDEQGNIYSADYDGHSGAALKPADIREYWLRVAETNACGLATMAMANKILQAALGSTLEEIKKVNREIEALTAKLADPSLNLTDSEKTAIQTRLAELRTQLGALNKTLTEKQATVAAAQNAFDNGKAAASITDTMVQNQRALSSKGFEKLSDGRFAIGGHGSACAFTAHTKVPASLEAINNREASSGDPNNTDWTASPSDFHIYQMPDFQTTSFNNSAPNSLLPPAQAATSVVPEGLSRMYLMEFNRSGNVFVTVLPAQPFNHIPVSEKQLLGVCFGATTTGDTTTVSWTATMRDETASWGVHTGGKHGGQPMAGNPPEWCEMSEFGEMRSDKHNPHHGGHKKHKSSQQSGSDVSFKFGPDAALANNPTSTADSDSFWDPNDEFDDTGDANAAVGGTSTSPTNTNPTSTTTKVAKIYRCGGLASEFQLRSPGVRNASFPKGTEPLFSDTTGAHLMGSNSSGQATAEVGGVKYVIPNTSNYVVRLQTQPGGPPTTMAPGGTVATPTVPPPPTDFL